MTHQAKKIHPLQQVRRLTYFSIACFIGFVLIVSALHILDPQTDLSSHYISEYVLGNYSILLVISLLLLGIGSVTLSKGFSSGIPKTISVRGFVPTLLVWGILICIAGIFPTDVDGNLVSVNGYIHGFASLIGFFSLVISAFLFAKYASKNNIGKQYGVVGYVLAILLLLTLIVFLFSDAAWKGIAQRIFLITVLSYLFSLAFFLWNVIHGQINIESE